MEDRTRAIGDAADAMTDDELETAIAALHARERELLVAGDSEAASALMGTKFVLLSRGSRSICRKSGGYGVVPGR
ncbi:hypothetical protein [Rhodococcus rhodochrous]|uniref:Uncharacterized protein n=1 Tax=Rhodococcus rhodochrous TaxID=1829 RepID=A0AA47AEA0_RHORH|nr:hypothetical protein [Rhodococcus rhodochrous]UZF48501.1 hypothetical protein KUM34_029465 [Rhodococcus rhodochrous]